MESTEIKDYFSQRPNPFGPQTKPSAVKRPSVSFTHGPSSPVERPHPMSRMSTHRLDSSTANFAEVLHNEGGKDGLKNLDFDYFSTVLDIFKDRKLHHSPVVFDFMLLHEINIHRLEHLLIAEWDWLSAALGPDQAENKPLLANQAPQRLSEIRTVLHDYCKCSFERIK